jgi:hypothetical protein
VLSFFSDDYISARARFRAATERAGWCLETLLTGGHAPDGSPLSMDIALSPNTQATDALVVSSGVHGVEGRVGSAFQLGMLEQWKPTPNLRAVFLHAINPYGFAWDRRFDEQNIDPNRNYLLEGETYTGAPPRYAALDGLLNPKSAPTWWDAFTLRAVLTVLRFGMPALRQAIAGGQYDFPKGVFFGGARPNPVNQLLAANLPRWLGSAKRVVHLDVHTGLGKWGECKLLVEEPLTSVQREHLNQWYGPESFEMCHSQGLSYRSRGDWGVWCVHQAGARDYLFLCAEFGTYPPIRVLRGLRNENRAFHWCAADDPRTRRARQELRDLFCPPSPPWREMVLKRLFDLVRRTESGLHGNAV